MIKLDENVYWDESAEIQSDEANNWITENVMQKLGVSDADSDMIIPEVDEYNRPYKWEYNGNGYTVVVKREYIAPVKWAKKCDTIKVYSNG